MAIIIGKRINLDAPIKVESLNGVTFTTESEAHQFVVRCEQKGQELTLTGTISAKFVRADGNTVQLVGSISDGAAVVTLAQDCYNVPGRFQLAIFNTVGDTKLCIYACVGTVQRAQSGNLIDGGGIISDVEDLIADIQAAVQSIPPTYDALLASIAGTYSASKTYAVGDYVWYDGSLYRCTTAITTAEAWTSGHWTAAVLGDDLSAIKSAFNDTKNIIGLASITYLQTQGVAHSSADDIVVLTVPTGTTIEISVTTSVSNAITGTIDFYGYYTDGTSSRIKLTSNRTFTAVLEKDLVGIGLYYGDYKATATSNVTVTLKSFNTDSFYGEYKDFSETQASQTQQLEKDMDSVRAFQLPLGEFVKNSYVIDSTGEITSYNNWCRTDYIDISALSEIWSISSVTSRYNCFYDANKAFISNFYVRTTIEKVSVPANAKYVIFSNSNSGMDALVVNYAEKFQAQSELIKNAFTGVYCEANIDSKLLEYGNLIAASGKSDTFLFFTDPHPFYGAQVGVDGWLNNVYARMPLVQKAYNSTPTSFCLCGGDWLSDQDTPAQASAKLGYVTGMMKHLFDRSYMVIGNHDTNYQGTEQLSTDALINVMFNEIGRMYYTFKNPNSRWYVFDTGTDWSHQMTTYKWAQIDWFANQLIENDDDHAVLALHIITNQYEADFDTNPVFHEVAQNITAVAQAYNNKTSITLNSITYDFSNTTGIVEFAIAGHSHYDKLTSLNSIPIMITDWLRDGDSSTFDLVLADYTNHVVKTVRIGTGSNRTMSMASA